MNSAPRRRGRSWEKQVADMVGGIHLGRPHEPDVVSEHLVIQCKNEARHVVSSGAIETAREDATRGVGKGKHWAVFKRKKGEQRFTVTLDGNLALELLAQAELIPRKRGEL